MRVERGNGIGTRTFRDRDHHRPLPFFVRPTCEYEARPYLGSDLKSGVVALATLGCSRRRVAAHAYLSVRLTNLGNDIQRQPVKTFFCPSPTLLKVVIAIKVGELFREQHHGAARLWMKL